MDAYRTMPKLRPTIFAPLVRDAEPAGPQALPPVSGTRTDSSPEDERLAGGTLGPSFHKGTGSLNWV